MDLEGNLILDRPPTRRWVSTIAVIIPVIACVAGVAWFVRAFISPPVIAIPGPMTLAAAPPAAIRPVREEPRAPEPAPPSAAIMQPAPTAPSAAAPVPSSSFSLPMMATLSAAPPATMSPTAFADRSAHPAGVHATLYGELEIGGQASVHCPHVQVGIEIRRNLDLDRTVDRGVFEIARAELLHPDVNVAVDR